MLDMIKSFKELTPELQSLAGRKGCMLSKMFQAGYPVPDGFVILPSAFKENILNEDAWNKIKQYLKEIRKNNESVLFAVRSSALSEDSAQASFAGEFETVLNVKTDEEIQSAIYEVFSSRESERVKAYSSVQGMDRSHQIAVVIQIMIQSEISGVLFTADPITGSHESMTGNFVFGLGEQLVSGEANAYPFNIMRPKRKYEGPSEFKKYASELYKYAYKLEEEYGTHQDIEWAVSNGKLYILQARPITTLITGNPDTYEWNDTLDGDFLWTNTNVGEAMSDVFTPLSWSIIRALDEEQMTIPGYYLFSGNICGRAYTNISYALSLYPAFGKDIKSLIKTMSEVFGQMPEEIEIPIYPFSKLGLIKGMAPKLKHRLKNIIKASNEIPEHLNESPNLCRRMTETIKEVKTKEELIDLWKTEILPFNFKALWIALAGGRKMVIANKLKDELIKVAGIEDTNTLMSNFRGDSSLESLGPIIGISKIITGEMNREEYRMKYGHRGPHEFELSIPHPGEDETWLEKQIEEFKNSNTDVEKLLNKQHNQYEEALKRLKENFPKEANHFEKKIVKVAEAARLRESVRSEWTRAFRVNRAFALKAGELTGMGNNIFFLYINEVLDLLSGNDLALNHIAVRKKNYEKYKSLPPLPSIIRGRFDPFKWVKNSNRRVDYYDESMPITTQDSETLKGFAGASGIIEGVVHILTNPEEGENLKKGEILVASTTNVGWTPLFPKASAIITDIGAPLSHAAIVARELGIPAVVGCGNATTKLKTGDKVIVDGGHGVVQILNS
ncbi:PEP/pyruvate-binding domain-containing protein [Clostridium beijerinckii]|jgi:Phosphoenolpyruvate synthase/pyruvate phosphate dikinase|uniref:Phosphoenolpyruvate synthase n=2 Tax=Clostridium beijerinckii TaxID=1520 RepID=A0AAE2V1E6_CLOBE|nr:PEP/pyruvate-binding domain-containing protein [Clostridium beijerinckii]ABR35977.1 pyruvate phosphate dikinase, PEP/pyruvate-binding [Clostridium beijerinckii NCIMB 8052]AIU03485.1 pyruvate phosphate dikinase, PEP/pyruvate-binding protein [Clostridium beijerinckii ATCC 35702]MBF7809382.1 phosphoenolpyruvate synthase [Clostridium beijerinckii]NRT22977.1 pyruvate,water dikinase [Clostridium beijerinckii]NRT69863.1 pyruvate,water dikinase [Clostridium beijerinckii]